MLTRSPRAVALAAMVALAPAGAVPALAQDAPISQTLPSFSTLVKAARPAVVTVMTSGRPMAQQSQQRMPEGMEEFFRRFGPNIPGMPDFDQRRSQPRQGLGSGFVVSQDGVIVTNNHVVDGADEITVRLEDGREFEAELVGRDDKIDLAVLRIEATDLPVLDWGDSDGIEVGDWAVAIGNPFGLGGTVTSGIVSARGRDLNSGPYDDYLQVDAAINRGNSGGPLLDLEGNVIGVNTMIFSPSGGNVGLGFAIPSAQAERIVADLLDDGTVERGWIGVRIQQVTPEIASSLGLEAAEGALVAEVTPGSPAEAAGLQSGDVILSFGGELIEELRDLTNVVADSAIGDEAEMQVWRAGARTTLEIAPERMETAAMADPAEPVTQSLFGMELRALTGDEQAALNATGGLLVTELEPDGTAARAGLRPGDVIMSVNQKTLDAPEDMDQIVANARRLGRDVVLLGMVRDGNMQFMTLPVPTS